LADLGVHAAIGAVLQDHESLEQVLARGDARQQLRILQQLAHAVAVERVALDGFVGLRREQLAYLAQPAERGELRGVKRAVPRSPLRSTPAATQLAPVEILRRRVGAQLDLGELRLPRAGFGIAPENEPPPPQRRAAAAGTHCIRHGSVPRAVAQSSRPSAASEPLTFWPRARLARNSSSPMP